MHDARAGDSAKTQTTKNLYSDTFQWIHLATFQFRLPLEDQLRRFNCFSHSVRDVAELVPNHQILVFPSAIKRFPSKVKNKNKNRI